MATPFDPRGDHQRIFTFPRLASSPPPPPPDSDDVEGFSLVKARKPKTVQEEEKEAHVLWDWDNGPLPAEYGIENLHENVQRGLRTYDPNLTIKSFTGCGEYYSLALNENGDIRDEVAKTRYEYLLDSGDFTVFKVPSRVRVCKICKESFPNLAAKTDHDRTLHLKKNYQDEFSRVMDVGDGILAREMKFIQYEYKYLAKSPGVIVLISGDKDFSSSTSFLIHRGWNVLVAEPDRESVYLRRGARAIWKWNKLVFGRKFEITQPRLSGY